MAKKKQTATTRARNRKSNGKERRTVIQKERQEKVFLRHVGGETIRQIAADLRCSTATVTRDLRAEEARRADELAERRATETARAVAYYEEVARDAKRRGEFYDELLAERNGAKVSDHTLDARIQARTRIDKLLGIDAPTKIEVGVQALVDALAPKPGEPDVLA